MTQPIRTRTVLHDHVTRRQRMAAHGPTLKQRAVTLWQRIFTAYTRLTAKPHQPPWERDYGYERAMFWCGVIVLGCLLFVAIGMNFTTPAGIAEIENLARYIWEAV